MDNSEKLIQSPLLQIIAIIYLSIETCFRPIIKYFEWHHDGIRINISVIYAILLIIALIEIILKLHSRRLIFPKDLSQSLAIILIIFIGLYELFHFPYITNHAIYRIDKFFLFYFSESVVRASLFLISGFYLFNIINNKKLNNLFISFWVIFTTVVFLFTDYNSDFFTSSIEVTREHNNYLMMSDAYAMLSFFIIANGRKLIVKFSVILISFFALYFLKSRASLYTFLVINLIGLILMNKQLLWFIFIVSVISLFTYDWSDFFRMNSNNRMFRLATFGQDASANIRANILSSGLNEIKANWLWGQFMGDVLIEKNTGTYIHNILSYLRQYGFFPFLFLIVIVVRNYLKLFYSVVNKNWSKSMQFVFLFGVHCLVLSLFARSFLYSGIWMFFTAIPVLIQNNKQSNSSN